MSIYPYYIALNFVSIWSSQHYMPVYSPKDFKRKFCLVYLSFLLNISAVQHSQEVPLDPHRNYFEVAILPKMHNRIFSLDPINNLVIFNVFRAIIYLLLPQLRSKVIIFTNRDIWLYFFMDTIYILLDHFQKARQSTWLHTLLSAGPTPAWLGGTHRDNSCLLIRKR